MYESQYQSNPNMVINPFLDTPEATVVFQSQVDFLDSLKKAVVDSCGCSGTANEICQPNVTLTELMNKLSINGIRFMFDPKLKQGKTVTPVPLPAGEEDSPVVAE